jgi:mannose-6-phosphate isomerase-like protein (cupin superfamily)
LWKSRRVARRGDFYENRVTGERAVVLRGDQDGEGESVLAHLTVHPGGAVVGEHIHPIIEERFHVITGRLQARIGGRERELGPGEEAVAPVGVPHDWWNAGEEEASVIVEITPPDPRFEAMIATMFGLANSGRTNAKGLPSPLQMALTGSEFADVIRMTRPPWPVQRVAFRVLGRVGRVRGLRPIYPELLSPHGTVEPDATALAAAGLD